MEKKLMSKTTFYLLLSLAFWMQPHLDNMTSRQRNQTTFLLHHFSLKGIPYCT